MSDLFQIKICGITTPNDAMMACSAGAEAIGINFFPPSPRFVDPEAALQIAESVDKYRFLQNRHVDKVGVFVNSSVQSILKLVSSCGLDAVQFHGDESLEEIAEVQKQLVRLNPRGKIIRAIRTASRKDLEGLGAEPDEVSRINEEVKMLAAIGVDAVLLDAAVAGEYGGTGNAIDWKAVGNLCHDLPIVLAGGLTPENVQRAIELSGVKSVDVASGVESCPGTKCHDKVTAFVSHCQQAFS